MNGPRFTSALGPDLERYLAFKESMGISCQTRVWHLRNFDRYCTQRALKNLDRATVEGWVSSRIACLPGGRLGRVVHLSVEADCTRQLPLLTGAFSWLFVPKNHFLGLLRPTHN